MEEGERTISIYTQGEGEIRTLLRGSERQRGPGSLVSVRTPDVCVGLFLATCVQPKPFPP